MQKTDLKLKHSKKFFTNLRWEQPEDTRLFEIKFQQTGIWTKTCIGHLLRIASHGWALAKNI